MELFKLALQIVTQGQKEAQQALQSVDSAGKQAAQGLGRTEAAMTKVGSASKIAETGLGAVKGQMAEAGAQALGLGSNLGGAAGILEGLGPIAVAVGVAFVGLKWIYSDLGLTASIAEEHADKLTAALGRQREAAERATVAGARLALVEAQNSLGRAPTGPGIVAGLKQAAAQALGGFGLAGAVAAEEQAKVARERLLLVKGLREAEIQLGEAIKRTGDSAAKSDNEQLRALASLIKGGNDVGNQRQQALLMVQGLTQALNALPVSDTIGRAGLAGQIKELNDALFPKLHAHVEKLKKELKQLSPLATGPHVGITPSGDDRMATAQGGGVVATDTIFGPMKTLPKTLAKTPEIINESGKQAVKALTEMQQNLVAAANTLAQTLGDAIYNAFASAFSGKGVLNSMKDFGKTILIGLGTVFKTIGEQIIVAAIMMKLIKQGLERWNPVLALGAGIALVALGGAIGGLAGGAAQRGFAQVGGYGSGSYNNAENSTRLKFVNRDGSSPLDGMTPRPNIYQTIIGVNDPAAQRAIREMYDKGGRR